MAMTRSEITARYDAVNSKTFCVKLNRKTDADIIETLDNAPSKQGYIKDAIRAYKAGTVPVSFSPEAIDILSEIAAEKGISVPDLIAVSVNEQLIRAHVK